MPDLSEFTVDQRLSLTTAARNLAREFDGVFSEETIELFLATSYDQFADRAKFNHFLPLLAERFARQRLKALAKVEGKTSGGVPSCCSCVSTTGTLQMALGWFNALAGDRATAWSGGSEPGVEVDPAASRQWLRSVLTLHTSTRSRGRRRSSKPPMQWSRWAAATPVRSSRASGTRIGPSMTRPVKTSPPCDRYATRSVAASASCSTRSALPRDNCQRTSSRRESTASRGRATP